MSSNSPGVRWAVLLIGVCRVRAQCKKVKSLDLAEELDISVFLELCNKSFVFGVKFLLPEAVLDVVSHFFEWSQNGSLARIDAIDDQAFLGLQHRGNFSFFDVSYGGGYFGIQLAGRVGADSAAFARSRSFRVLVGESCECLALG